LSRRVRISRGAALLGLIAAAFGALAASGVARAELPPEIARVLTAHSIPLADASVVVQEVDAGEPVLSHLASESRSPASVMKVITTWSALEMLGPAYTWPTEVYFMGGFDGTKLDGNLALKGYGDPYLVEEEVWKMVRAVRRIGLSSISGDLVLDDSFFDTSAEPEPGAFDGQPYRTYNVVPSAILMNFKAVSFQFRPDRGGTKVNVTTDPILENLKVDNNLELGDGACGGYQAGIAFNHRDTAALDEVVLDGKFSRRCNAYALSRTALQHDTYAFGLFEQLWKESGGSFNGKLGKAVVPAEEKPALVWRSRPLGEVIRSINKNSNNVMTRQLVYTLGAELGGAPGTREKGVAAIRSFLESRKIDAATLVMQNGAGLSRDERASAGLLASVLRAAYKSPYAAEFVSSLSLGGQDGTTRGRFEQRATVSPMHVKTGRLDHVSALVGYVHAPTGKTYVIAVILNTENAHRGPGQELEEAVVRWVQGRP
jgi:D-alanyl-D-alanine carboxypeptidase/D-alanyl-D-alanine-endopeptidase (penicillin-binding protein 4)